jgi:hypothetical protein
MDLTEKDILLAVVANNLRLAGTAELLSHLTAIYLVY